MTNASFFSLPAPLLNAAVNAALVEDLGRAGDITTNFTIPADAVAEGKFVSREKGIVSGLPSAQAAFRLLDPSLELKLNTADGDRVGPGDVLATINGNARAVLSAERVALNYLMHLSGIATATAGFVEQVAHTGARIICTRKTIPGDRLFAKYAVLCGGGLNHRYGLDDGVLIKDNHIAVCGSIRGALEAARARAGSMVKIEIEVDGLDQLREALSGQPDAVLLDNMSPEDLARAVTLNRADNGGRIKLEASGGVDIDTVRAIAETGVDYISTSKITISAPSFDIGLDMDVK